MAAPLGHKKIPPPTWTPKNVLCILRVPPPQKKICHSLQKDSFVVKIDVFSLCQLLDLHSFVSA